tara:strand:- start:62 stop:565 length:504 start_codon:yes stop_codon:yes gene_type:complete
MEVYRYNTKNRQDRNFNTCGEEKNPNAINFYATNMAYADNYKFIYNDDGEVALECKLEVALVDTTNLFDMNKNFSCLTSYSSYINSQVEKQMNDYTNFMNNSKKLSDKKMWANQIDALKNRGKELTNTLISNEFQTLSDFSRQNKLVSELKNLGFNGYKTKNEVVIF